MNLLDMKKTDITIKQVLFCGEEPRFVEFYSIADSRNQIISADRFCEIFGYEIDELKEMK